MSTNTNPAAPESQIISIRKIDQYVNVSHKTRNDMFKACERLTFSGYNEIVPDYNPDPADDESHISYVIYYNQEPGTGLNDIPTYYLFITGYNRLYSCTNILEVTEIIKEYKVIIETEKPFFRSE